MIYTTIRGGEDAIRASHRLLAEQRRGNPAVEEITVTQISEQLSLAVDRVMAEGALYDRVLAGLAVKQAQGDLVEAIFMLRAFRTTLPRFGSTNAVDTSTMVPRRRISPTHKDVPFGQVLGPTYDFTHRLLDFGLMGGQQQAKAHSPDPSWLGAVERGSVEERIDQAIVEQDRPLSDDGAFDITRKPVSYPTQRDSRLQALARGDEGFLTGVAYSSLRGYGTDHPFVSELQVGDVTVEMELPEEGITVAIGEITLTECKTLHQPAPATEHAPQFTRGYGLVFGHLERKAIAMAFLDRTLRSAELDESVIFPAQDEEFVLGHADNVQASGLIQHFKLPHYVDYQATVQLLYQMRDDYMNRQEGVA